MNRSLLKYSAWISLVCMLFASCSSSSIFVSGDAAGKLRESLLSNSFEKITCRAKVTFHKNELSGLMLIKKTEEGNFKLAFYNELGMTYLEGIFENSSKHKELIVKNIVPALNHKPFIKSFEKSLHIIFSPEYSNQRLIDGTGFLSDELIIQEPNGFRLEVSIQN